LGRRSLADRTQLNHPAIFAEFLIFWKEGFLHQFTLLLLASRHCPIERLNKFYLFTRMHFYRNRRVGKDTGRYSGLETLQA
jgi:hypothetical protein